MNLTMKMKRTNLSSEVFAAYSFRIRAPSGTMFLVANESEGKLDNVQIYIGKTGSNLYAYVNAIADLINVALANGASLEDIISTLSNLTSDKVVYNENTPVRSDIDAIVFAFLRYKQQKFLEQKPSRKPYIRRLL